MINKKVILSAILILLAIAWGYIFYLQKTVVTPVKAQEIVQDYVTNNMVDPGTKVEVKSVTEDGGLYKVVMLVEKKEYVSYLSKNGKRFFPQGLAIDADAQDEGQQEAKAGQKPAQVEVPKQSKPVVELFVMSYCPFGTQIEKGIAPVVAVLKDKIDFQLKFVDYAMHGEKEVQENLKQHCIQQQSGDKLQKYLGCFLKDSTKADECLTSAQINASDLASCEKVIDEKFKITEGVNDKNQWQGQFPPFKVDQESVKKYSVQGSPSLVINGVEVSAARDPKSLLETICNGFDNQPEECKQELSSETPSSGFGEGASSGNNSSGGCGE